MIPRRYNILKLLGKGQSLLVLGPRGSGKTYLINSILDSGAFSEVLKINLLSGDDFGAYVNSPSLLARQVRARINRINKPLIVLVDEIQLVPSLLNEVHLLIEELREKVVFILTGSSARKLKRANANLLAGRALLVPFFPVSSLEYDFELNFEKIIRFGSLPKVLEESDNELIIHYLKAYTLAYLKEEVQQEALVRNLPAFSRFLELAAQYNGTPVNYSKLAKVIGVSANTVQGYYSILEETLIARAMPAWTHSIRLQLQQAPRYYLFDHGIIRTLCGELQSELNERSSRFGHIFEAMVVNELIKAIELNGSELKLYSFRTETSKEIDLILQSGPFAAPIGVEIKSDTAPTARDVRSLFLLRTENPQARLVVLCRCRHPYEEDGIEFEPYLEGIRKLTAGD